MPDRPTPATEQRLWALAGNECANPDCAADVIDYNLEKNVAVKLGEIAHIHGNKSTANRHLASQSKEERHGFDNLLVLCSPCHTIVDDKQNENHYPAKLLKAWKREHLKKVLRARDRNWITYPQAQILFDSGVSTYTRYWIDKNGKPQLFTPEQLAIVEQLVRVGESFREIAGMLDMIEESEGKPCNPSIQNLNDARIGQLFKLAAHLPKAHGSWFGYLTETLQLAQDVTLGELLLMQTKGGVANREETQARGKRVLAERATQIDPTPKARWVGP